MPVRVWKSPYDWLPFRWGKTGLIYRTISKISFGRKPKRPSSMDRAAKIVIQTVITLLDFSVDL